MPRDDAQHLQAIALFPASQLVEWALAEQQEGLAVGAPAQQRKRPEPKGPRREK